MWNIILFFSLAVLCFAFPSVLDKTYYRLYFKGDGQGTGIYNGRMIANATASTRGISFLTDTKGYSSLYQLYYLGKISVTTFSDSGKTILC